MDLKITEAEAPLNPYLIVEHALAAEIGRLGDKPARDLDARALAVAVMHALTTSVPGAH